MITFRKGKEEDLDLIRDIARATWPSTYGHIFSQELLDYGFGKMYNKGELLRQLMDGYIFLIAAVTDDIAGFACFSKLPGDGIIYKLHKLYVLPAFHGKGVGKVLMNEVINQAKRDHASALQLNVNQGNKAKRFYDKAGFKIKEPVTLDIGNGFIMNDYIMELPLND